MSFYGMLSILTLLAGTVQTGFLLTSVYHSNSIADSYYTAGSAILISTELNLVNSGTNPYYLNFTSRVNGIEVDHKNHTYVIKEMSTGIYSVIER